MKAFGWLMAISIMIAIIAVLINRLTGFDTDTVVKHAWALVAAWLMFDKFEESEDS